MWSVAISLTHSASSDISPSVRLVSICDVIASKSHLIFSGLVRNPIDNAFSLIHFRISCCLSDLSKSLVECRLLAYLSAVFPSNT